MSDTSFHCALARPIVVLQELERLAWNGVPHHLRPSVWPLLLHYVPPRAARIRETLERRRREYRYAVMGVMGDAAFDGDDDTECMDDRDAQNYRQIERDVPRTRGPAVVTADVHIQRRLQRMLFLWSTRHPASGYVQGINDVMLPFLVALAPTDVVDDDAEADAFFCASRMLEVVIEQYTASQREIQRSVRRMRQIVERADAPLARHLDVHEVGFEQFAFRWFNCLLTRELPPPQLLRLWDAYVADVDAFPHLHVCVCAAFLCTWSRELLCMTEFQDIILFLQRPPTAEWTDDDVGLLLSRAHVLAA